MTFQRPVRLRDRVPVPPKGPTIAAGSALAAVGAGAALYLWLRRRTRGRACLTVAPVRKSRTFLATSAPSATSTSSNSSFFTRSPSRRSIGD